jgi:ribonuclease BN (tRNA processing enzyme)
MEIKVLGCYGNNLLDKKTTSLVINKTIAIDAGAITSSLALNEQIILDHILITHSHLDHIKDLAFLGDNVINRRDTPIKLYGEANTLKAISNHYFNNIIWPDFTKIPDEKNPVFEYREIKANDKIKINGLEIKAVKTKHTVPSVSYFIRDYKNTVCHITDTGLSKEIWKEVNKEENLKAIFIEASFPSEMKDLATASKHLTPYDLIEELGKVNIREKEIDVYVYHLKPLYLAKLEHEITKLSKKGFNIMLMKQGEIINYV